MSIATRGFISVLSIVAVPPVHKPYVSLAVTLHVHPVPVVFCALYQTRKPHSIFFAVELAGIEVK